MTGERPESEDPNDPESPPLATLTRPHLRSESMPKECFVMVISSADYSIHSSQLNCGPSITPEDRDLVSSTFVRRAGVMKWTCWQRVRDTASSLSR